jgi:hypothetical protein
VDFGRVDAEQSNRLLSTVVETDIHRVAVGNLDDRDGNTLFERSRSGRFCCRLRWSDTGCTVREENQPCQDDREMDSDTTLATRFGPYCLTTRRSESRRLE